MIKIVRMIATEYNAEFLIQEEDEWKKIANVGNTGVAEQFVEILRTLGHNVQVIYK